MDKDKKTTEDKVIDDKATEDKATGGRDKIEEMSGLNHQEVSRITYSGKRSADMIGSKLKEVPREFVKGLLSFLKEYSVIGLAIGLIIGQASKELVDSIVNGLFMPLIKLLISKDGFENLSFVIKGVSFELGRVISSLLTFIIVMALLYVIIKKIIKRDELLKKK